MVPDYPDLCVGDLYPYMYAATSNKVCMAPDGKRWSSDGCLTYVVAAVPLESYEVAPVD